jgi:hypothetical protein
MLDFLRGKASDRKFRLFACACVRRLLPLFRGEDVNWTVLSVSERHAEGLATKHELKIACSRADRRARDVATASADAFHAATGSALGAAHEMWSRATGESSYLRFLIGPRGRSPAADRIVGEERRAQCDLLRDVFSNPFRPIPSVDLPRLTSNVRDLGRTIYEERAFDRLPILADALMDAGCTDEAILSHCRSEGPHVRGCWVVDLLLGKE